MTYEDVNKLIKSLELGLSLDRQTVEELSETLSKLKLQSKLSKQIKDGNYIKKKTGYT